MIDSKLSSPKLLFLGCGASSGVPVIGCSCSVCHSPDVKNRRLRSSVYVTTKHNSILIDAGPDFRAQALKYRLDKPPTAFFLTHSHYDHMAGVEELRIYNFLSGNATPCYLSSDTMEAFKKIFYYQFVPKSEQKNYTAHFEYHVFSEPSGSLLLNGDQIKFCTYHQGGMPVLGFRFGSLAYMTDIKEFDQSHIEFARDAETLIISAIRHGASTVQLNVDEAVDFARRASAKRTILMHMSHELEYHHLRSLLPKDVEPAYDGLEVAFDM